MFFYLADEGEKTIAFFEIHGIGSSCGTPRSDSSYILMCFECFGYVPCEMRDAGISLKLKVPLH
jgi:hypothetical protein